MNNSYLNDLDYKHVRGAGNKRKIRWIGLLLLFIILVFTVIFTTRKVTAKREGYRTKQITSVEIQKGDTLWSIASGYISEEYDDMKEYIDEIMVSNGLASDNIKAGSYIIVPYYADTSR